MTLTPLTDIRAANKLIQEGKEIAIISMNDVVQLTKKHLEFADEPALTRQNIRIMFQQWCGVDVKYGWKYYLVEA